MGSGPTCGASLEERAQVLEPFVGPPQIVPRPVFPQRVEKVVFGVFDVLATTTRSLHEPPVAPLPAFTSFQHDFPALYGVIGNPLPYTASTRRRIQAEQLKGPDDE